MLVATLLQGRLDLLSAWNLLLRGFIGTKAPDLDQSSKTDIKKSLGLFRYTLGVLDQGDE